MKILKFTVAALFLLNVALPVFQSCTKESAKASDPVTLESLVNAYNIGLLHENEKAAMLEGVMTIMTLPSKEVIFFLKPANSPDNHILIGQGTELPSMLQKDLGLVKVAYLKDAIAVEDKDGNIYTFTIGVRKGHELIQKLNSDWAGTGYGLILNYNRSEGPADFKGMASTEEFRGSVCKCRLANQSDTDCDSGGLGAASCSIGSTTTDPGCSVSCSVGFACCQTE